MGAAAVAIAIGKFLTLAGVSVAAVCDLTRRIIPNTLVLMVAGGGLLLRFGVAGRYGVVTSVTVAFAVFLVLRVLMNVIALGGGDTKLIAAVTLGQSLTSAPALLLSIAVCGGMLSIIWLAQEWMTGERGSRAFGVAALHADMPYAPAVLGGLVFLELQGIVT